LNIVIDDLFFTEVPMRKAPVVALFLLLAASLVSAQGLNWLTGSLDEAFAKAKAENKLVLLDFNSYT